MRNFESTCFLKCKVWIWKAGMEHIGVGVAAIFGYFPKMHARVPSLPFPSARFPPSPGASLQSPLALTGLLLASKAIRAVVLTSQGPRAPPPAHTLALHAAVLSTLGRSCRLRPWLSHSRRCLPAKRTQCCPRPWPRCRQVSTRLR
jgi:hypothetical protein